MIPRDRVYFLAKDPHWAFVWWELSGSQEGQLTLRVVADDAPILFDVPVTGSTDHWYLHLPVSGRTYRVYLGFRSADGELHTVAGSKPLSLPPDGASGRRDESWSTVPMRRSRWKKKATS